MKTIKFLFLSLLLLLSAQTNAGPVTFSQAEQKAREFLDKQGTPHKGRNMKLAKKTPQMKGYSDEGSAFFVFNIGDNEGFVMVSGDDCTPPILGYTSEGTFEPETMPAHVRAWFDGIAEQLAYLQENGSDNALPRLANNRAAIEPMLKSTWGQGAPYNNQCPMDPVTGERCVTGCVATALAQVVNYHKHPAQTLATIPAYTSGSGNSAISMPAINVTAIDWPNMRNNYNSNSTQVQQDAVAKLMLLCGQGLNMTYSSSGSGAYTYNDVSVLQYYFGYDRTTRILSRDYYGTEAWESIIYNELSARRPVIYSAQSVNAGHSFVIDGYDEDGLFHINWGWDGSYDGFFLLSVLNPNSGDGMGAKKDGGSGYSYCQEAVVGIQHGTDDVVYELMTVFNITNTGDSILTRTSSDEDFTNISIQVKAYNKSGLTRNNFGLGLVLLDANGQWVDDLSSVSWESLNNHYGGIPTFSELSFGADLPDGEYYIVLVMQRFGSHAMALTLIV